MFASTCSNKLKTAISQLAKVGQQKKLTQLFMLSAGIGSGLMAAQTLAAQAVEPASQTPQFTPSLSQAAESSTGSPLAIDGVYLYGQSPQPEQLGAAYMVFEARDGMTIGAFYMPNSSFDCFYGPLQANQAALTVVDSYSRETFSYNLALQQQDAIADSQGAAPLQFDLEGFYRLAELSDLDREVLATCKADHQEQVWQ
ncbi:hypothetical protein [Almyronema epifaneia]|uniref:Uncharacterized protein n=1 Tax=Almyronema epifaneia S1 TaxID=2991925 RepID=A0ABW6IGR2_9CYAN